MRKVFISYAREDRDAVGKLDQILIEHGCLVWRDQTSIHGGQHWPKAIGEAIQSNEFLMLVWSKAAARSKMVEFEWNTAMALGKMILPCLLDETPLPPTLRSVNGIEYGNFEKVLPQILESSLRSKTDVDPTQQDEVIKKLESASLIDLEELTRIVATLVPKQTPDDWRLLRGGVLIASTLAGLALVLLLVIFVEPGVLHLPLPDLLPKKLAVAIDYYQAADFDRAISLLEDLRLEESVDVKYQKETLLYLAGAYMAKEMNDEARDVVNQLFELLPSFYPDPDSESISFVRLYFEVTEKLERDANKPRYELGTASLVVMKFMNDSVDDKERFSPMERGFAALMIANLARDTDFKIMAPEQLGWFWGDMERREQGQRVGQDNTVGALRELGATIVLRGSFMSMNRQMQIMVQVVEVKTGEIVVSEQVQGRTDNYLELAEQLSLRIASSTNSWLSPTEIGQYTRTNSRDATLSYAEGLILLEQGDYRGALAKFLEALDYDPSYTRARRRADSLVPMLDAMSETEGSDND